MPVVYADAVFLENLAVDYILLIAASRISGVPARRWRAAAAAALGGVYALVSVLAPGGVLTSFFVKLSVGLVMVVTVFGLRWPSHSLQRARSSRHGSRRSWRSRYALAS